MINELLQIRIGLSSAGFVGFNSDIRDLIDAMRADRPGEVILTVFPTALDAVAAEPNASEFVLAVGPYLR